MNWHLKIILINIARAISYRNLSLNDYGYKVLSNDNLFRILFYS